MNNYVEMSPYLTQYFSNLNNSNKYLNNKKYQAQEFRVPNLHSLDLKVVCQGLGALICLDHEVWAVLWWDLLLGDLLWCSKMHSNKSSRMFKNKILVSNRYKHQILKRLKKTHNHNKILHKNNNNNKQKTLS